MGVNIKDLVEGKPIELEALRNRKIGIDAYNWIYQFLSSIRDRFTGECLRDSKGNVTSHLSGLFYRTAKLLENGIIPIYIFDGKPPEFKKKTTEKRMEIRKEAEVKWKEAVEKGDVEAVKRYSQQASKLTPEMTEEGKKLLNAMGVWCVQAPSEGEAQISTMVKNNQLWAGASSDYDSLLFGMPKLVRNLNIVGKKKMPGKQVYVNVKPEMIELESVLSVLGINHDQLILLGILVGTDYAPGVKGVGPKTALKLVKEHKTLDAVSKNVNWECDISMEKIFDFFKNPPVEDVKLEKKKLDPEEIKKVLVDNHDFSEDRLNSTLDKLKEKKKSGQTGLGKFL